MRHTKMIALWSFGGLMLAVSAAVVFLTMMGDDFYRWAMRQAIEGTIDREIHVEGSFSFDIGLEPALTVTDVWIENAAWASKAEMARAKRIEIQIALRPLLSGIVLFPRFVVEGLDLDLETSSDGQNNWEIVGANGEDGDAAILEDPIYPLFKFGSLKDIFVTYSNHRSGRNMEILLDTLKKTQPAQDASFEIQGEGSFNRRPFQITGRYGSIKEAMAATTPYPFELIIQSSSVVVDMAGTALDIVAAEGFDVKLAIRTASISEMLGALEIDLPVVGLAEVSARLKGNLESLSVEDIDLEVIERSGQELHMEGRIADVVSGLGLDLSFTGKLGPETLRWIGDLPVGLNDVLDDASQMDLLGSIKGELGAPVIEDLRARLEHGSDGELSLQGRAAFDFSEKGVGLTKFEAQTHLFLPDQELLEKALETSLPDLGPIDFVADLAWATDWITLRAAEMQFEELGQLRFNAEGQIGELSGNDFAFQLAPLIDLSLASNHSGPIVTLLEQLAKEIEPTPDTSSESSAVLPQERGTGAGADLVFYIQRSLKAVGSNPGPLDGKMGPRTRAGIEDYQARHGLTVDGRPTEDLLSHLRATLDETQERAKPENKTIPSPESLLAKSLPDLGPVKVAVQLSLDDGAYRFENLNLTLGRKEAIWVDAAGTLGAFRPGNDAALEGMDLEINLAVPSSQTIEQLLPPETPEFRKIRGRFDLQGTTEALSISDARMTAEGPDGLVAAVSGQAAKISFATGFKARGLAFDLDARWPNTEGVYRLFDLDLPELGPVRARASLMDKGETFSLTEINVAAGSPDMPLAQVSGQVGDLLALKEIMLTGEFDVSTATLLDLETVIGETRLGNVHGQFNLSDTDGSIGLEALSAEIEDTKLLSLSVNGLFDDIKQRDELRVEATLSIPDVPQLGREFGFEVEHIDSLTFQGEVSGSDERFNAEGHARLGETDITGTLSGTLKGERPSLRAKLYSPLFRFADVGLVPQPDALETTSKSVLKEPAQGVVFDDVPISFEVLKQFDLDLDVLLEDMEGVHVEIDKAEGRLDVVDGVLRVDPLSFNFVGGRVDLTLLADANKEPPELHIGLAADDVDLGDFLSQTNVEVPLDGELDLLVDLRASGHSPRALASSLEGEFDMAIQRGHVLTSLLDLTTTNPASWLFTESARRGYSELNCLILRFDLQDGVAESQTVVLDTPNILALGEGRTDLRREMIDLEFAPHAKRRRLLDLSTPFAIRGPLANPSLEFSSGGTAFRVAGEVLLSPLNLLGSLLPFVGDRGSDEDNPCLVLQESLQRQ